MIRNIARGLLTGIWLFPWWLMLLLAALGAAAQIALMKKGRGWFMTKLSCVLMLLAEGGAMVTSMLFGRDGIGYAFIAAAVINTALLILVGAALGFAAAALYRWKRGES